MLYVVLRFLNAVVFYWYWLPQKISFKAIKPSKHGVKTFIAFLEFCCICIIQEQFVAILKIAKI